MIVSREKGKGAEKEILRGQGEAFQGKYQVQNASAVSLILIVTEVNENEKKKWPDQGQLD